MRIAFVAAVLVAVVVSSAAKGQWSPSPTPTDTAKLFQEVGAARVRSDFMLMLIREYGRAAFTECRVGVVVFENRGSSQLWCRYAKGPAGDPPPLFAREELSPHETVSLINLFQRAALYEGGHIGVDGTPTDGIFETLKVTSQSRTAVLVTSGNSTFESDSARKELLSQLHIFEKRLRSKTP